MSTDDGLSDRGSERVGEHTRIYLRKDIWQVSFQFNKRQHRQSLDTRNKKTAQRRAARIDADVTAGTWGQAVDPPTVAEAAAAYLDFQGSEDRAAATLEKYRQVLGRVARLAAEYRVPDLSGLDTAFVDAYRQQRTRDGVSEKTKYTECVILRQLIHFALKRNLLAEDPQKGVKLRKPKPTRQPCWTAEEVRAILAAAPAWVRPTLVLLAETGLRFGELAWLTWADVDAAANVLHVRPKDGWKPKSGDQRAVPISPAARTALAELPKKWRWVTTMPPSGRCPEAGRQWSEKRLLGELKRALKALGYEGKLHTFRHTFISNALLKGVPVPTVRAWVGHVDRAVIDQYTHIHDAASQEAMRRLGRPESE